jgi:hypothetical protein
MLKVTLECVDACNPDSSVVSTLQLVDLAGSERQSQTGSVATKESIEINKSLMTLRQVITALTENNDNQTNYVPYRDSKLTCLLRQSLGGNSFCMMIACLNPCDQHIEENLSTLNYAARASFISNKPVKNTDPKLRLIAELKDRNAELVAELNKANETIKFLTRITGQNPSLVTENLHFDDSPAPTRIMNREDSAETTKLVQKPKNHAANETKEAITNRIIHTVNMMKEVL